MSNKLDELNKLFTSKNPEDIIRFYDHFDNAEQLISWMKNRPSAPMRIYEQEGKKDIVIVIPTSDHNGKLANNCKKIFKGLQIVFVESNGPFFNYARSCNFGLKYASKYKSKWLILSNDDIQKIDYIEKLKSNLSEMLNDIDVIYINPSNYHSFTTFLSKGNVLLRLSRTISGKPFKGYDKLLSKFSIKYDTVSKLRLSKGRVLLYKKIHYFINIGDFSIFSASFVSSHQPLLNEAFVNDYEDLYLSLSISLDENIKKNQINFNIKSSMGGTMGRTKIRTLRDVASLAYFNKLLMGINNQKLKLK